MTKREYTNYQKKVISSYYHHLDTIALGRLQELVSELYLADTDKKRDKLWERVGQAIDKLAIPASLKEHILARRDVKVLAANLEQWLKK
ncbi:MAG: hypothetical protein LLF76_10790 [Planctomycetaceae bacterium]|nr:hypothetical protein [Planctomycetaceae bacterium]